MKTFILKQMSLAACTCLLCIALLSLPACNSGSPESGRPDVREAPFRSGLAADGFIVQDGFAHPIDPIVRFDMNRIDSCGGNNAGQPYKLLRIPLLPGTANISIDKDLGLFMLRPDEAVVYVGPTPPQADYFSFTPFVFVRHEDPVKAAKGDWIFAAVGDPLNSAIIGVEGGGSSFGKRTVIIFAADQGIYERVAAQARAAGFPDSMINRYILPPELLRLGISKKSDSLLILLRTANFADKPQGDAYLDDDSYAKVWRVTPDPVPATLNPFPTPPMRTRKAVSETTMYPDLEAGLERLKAAILARTARVQERAFESIRWFEESRDVLMAKRGDKLYGKFVAGEASDTPYRRTSLDGSPANFTLGPNDMIVVYGVNHAATGLAAYSSIGVYGDWISSSCENNPLQYVIGCGDHIWNGVAGMTSHDFAGSAEQYIQGDPMAPYLYAVKVLRRPPSDPMDKYWIVVPEPSADLVSYSYGIALDKPITIGYRAYLNPATGSGPDYGDTIPDRSIWFKLKN